MTHILLLDLDDTLIDNSMETFLPAYTRELGKHMLRYAEPPVLVDSLVTGTRKMVDNLRPDRTLEEVFDSVFYPALGVDKAEVHAHITAFYQDIFPSFHSLTQRRPEAIRFIEEAQALGYRLVLATNPLFPRSAILHRVAWAGFPTDPFPFELVPSYETFHYSKPHPAFFAELLANIGWPDGPVVMIGNDPIRDIAPARRAGLSTFWVNTSGKDFPSDIGGTTASGSLSEVLDWIDNTPASQLTPEYKSPQALTAILRSTPALLDSLTRTYHVGYWYQRPEPGEWSLTEIACHLRDVDHEVNLPRIQKMVEEENPFIPGQETDSWAVERDYIAQSCFQAVENFIAIRMKLLALLDQLEASAWSRPARHAIFGPTELIEMVSIIGGHDRMHAHQIHSALSKITAEQ